jgi:hypothetical protein
LVPERLGDESTDSQRIGFAPRALILPTRHDDGWNVLGKLELQPRQDTEPVNLTRTGIRAGKCQIKDHHIRQDAVGLDDCLRPVRGGGDFIALSNQYLAHQFAGRGVIFNDQHSVSRPGTGCFRPVTVIASSIFRNIHVQQGIGKHIGITWTAPSRTLPAW